jgi:hypothetical protein
MAETVEHLLCKEKAQSSNPSPAKEKKISEEKSKKILKHICVFHNSNL